MEAVRMVMRQQKANYKKEEAVSNSMTYPLPPYSTVIGAIHEACGYKEYHDMRISIQGKYKVMRTNFKRKYVWFNARLGDRGTLCKMVSTDKISTAHTEIARANVRGASFKNKAGITVKDNILLDEYIKAVEEKDKNKLQYYRVKDNAIRYIEVLTEVELVVHIHSDEKTMCDIKNNALSIKAVGRSSDMIELESAEIVMLKQEQTLKNDKYHAYIPVTLLDCFTTLEGSQVRGTKYYLNKKYSINKKKREFEKVKAIYASQFQIQSFSKDVWEDEEYIVCFA